MKRSESKTVAKNRKITISDAPVLIPTSVLQEFSNVEVSLVFVPSTNLKRTGYNWTIYETDAFLFAMHRALFQYLFANAYDKKSRTY